MNKQKITIKANAIFLAIVLIAGTIALISPSFMTGAEAYPYNQGNDNNDHKFKYKPSFGKSFDKKSAECINVNLNFPGLDFSPTFGAKAEALGVESLARDGGNSGPGPNGGNHGPESFDKDSFICINANDNNIRGGIDRGDGEEPPTCKTCFTDNLSQEELTALLELLSGTPLRDLEGLCDVLSNPSATNQNKLDLIIGLFNIAGINDDEGSIVDVLKCLRDLGIITGPIPTP